LLLEGTELNLIVSLTVFLCCISSCYLASLDVILVHHAQLEKRQITLVLRIALLAVQVHLSCFLLPFRH